VVKGSASCPGIGPSVACSLVVTSLLSSSLLRYSLDRGLHLLVQKQEQQDGVLLLAILILATFTA